MNSILTTTIIAAAAAISSAPAVTVSGSTYVLQQEYSGANFFDGFDFFDGSDPTNGNVTYLSRYDAFHDGLISAQDGQPAYMGVDFWTPNAVAGRKSVRISSQRSFTHGLVISDIAHMPGGICGTWPAHWTVGPNWPLGGEIDIIEGINSGSENLMSLHTSPGCTIAGSGQTGSFQSPNCDTSLNYNAGCGSVDTDTDSYGTGFNSISSATSGSVYAMQWTSDYIRIWFFPAGSVPIDIDTANPDPSKWGTPTANFEGSCSIDDHFYDHSIIFDTTFCGDYAGNNWNSDDTCKLLAPTCNDYVQQNPSAFKDAYWSINSVKYYELQPEVFTSTVTPTSSTRLTSATPQSSVIAPALGGGVTTTASSSFTSAPSAGIAAPSAGNPNFGNTTSNSSSSYTAVIGSNPARIGSFTSAGGVTSLSFPGTLVRNSDDMSLEICTSSCAEFIFAAVFDTACYCSDSSPIAFDGAEYCNLPCPGNTHEICGGVINTSAFALSIYAQSAESAAAAVAAAAADSLSTSASVSSNAVHYLPPGSSSLPSSSITSAIPQYSVIPVGMGGSHADAVAAVKGASAEADVFTTVLTTAYVTICPTGLKTVTATITVEHCGCTETPASIPLTTVTEVCTACAGAPTVTLTVPAATSAASTTSAVAAALASAGSSVVTVSICPVVTFAVGSSTSTVTLAPTLTPTFPSSAKNGTGSISTASPTVVQYSIGAGARTSISMFAVGVAMVIGFFTL